MKIPVSLLVCALVTATPIQASEPASSLPESFVIEDNITNTPPVEASLSQPTKKIKKQKYKKPPIYRKHWNENTKVWLARSCVGESGFWAEDECMAIAWIYARRARLVGWPLLKMIRRYSAATKPHEVHRRPWIFELDAKAEKPKHWPKTIRWQRHRKAWLNLLARLDRWKDGHEPDPMPEADHYGSYRDANQSRYVRTWKRVEAPAGFKNLYFNSSVRYARAVDKYTRWMINK